MHEAEFDPVYSFTYEQWLERRETAINQVAEHETVEKVSEGKAILKQLDHSANGDYMAEHVRRQWPILRNIITN